MAFQLGQIQRFLSPNAYKDLDAFLEKLPSRAGHGLVIAGGIAWAVAGFAVLYAVMQANHVMGLRADILKAEALKPTVPIISRRPVEAAQVAQFTEKLNEFYPQLNLRAQGSAIDIRATRTDMYGAFREAVGHLFNGGQGWRVEVDSLCVGRECPFNTGVQGVFTINRMRVEKPAG